MRAINRKISEWINSFDDDYEYQIGQFVQSEDGNYVLLKYIICYNNVNPLLRVVHNRIFYFFL